MRPRFAFPTWPRSAANPGPPECNIPFFQGISFRGQRGRMARGGRKVLMTETWSYGGTWYSDGRPPRVWQEGHGWYGATGGGWNTPGDGWENSARRASYEMRHMNRRAVTVAYMDGSVELLYPPPPPNPPTAYHPLSGAQFAYDGP
jgi:prepilin-type processing-associated H-X9-DG protein